MNCINCLHFIGQDIGSGGAYLSLKNKVDIGERLRLIIDPGQSDLEMKGTVVRVVEETGGKRGVGITFDSNC